MKKLFTLAMLCMVTIGASAQLYEYSGKALYYEGVIRDTTSSKDQLFTKALEWMALTYKSSKSVIQMQDRTNGIIIGKGSLPYAFNSRSFGYEVPVTGYVDYTINLQFKDGRFKYVLSDFNTDGYGTIYDGEITKFVEVKGMFVNNKKMKQLQHDSFKRIQEQVISHAVGIELMLKRLPLRQLSVKNDW